MANKLDVESPYSGLPFAPIGLPRTQAEEVATVRWVARHIDVADPDPATCPDPFGWTILRVCRSNPAFLAFFIEKLWAKLIPARSQLDSAGPKVVDGQAQLDLIGRIESMRDEAERAEGTRRVASPKAKAAPVRDAFADLGADEEG